MKVKDMRTRGVALLLTLVVSFFLVVLLGAFLVVNRGNSSLTVNSLKRQQAYNACMTGLHYAWGELELNQGWGAGGFRNAPATGFPTSSPKLIVTVRGDRDNPEDLEANYVEAEIPGTGTSFKIKMVNNLRNRAVMEDTQIGNVPGRSAKFEIEGRANGTKLVLSSILRKKPYVDYSALSNQNLSVELRASPSDERNWKIRSKDPYVNQIRSNAEILGPSAIGNKVKFSDPPRGGVAKATDDILLDGTSVQSDPDFLVQSERTARGQFQVGSASIDVPGLERDDLRFPDREMTIPGGDLKFAPVEKHEWTSQTFDVGGTEVERWRLVKTQYQSIQHGSEIWVGTEGFPLEDSGAITGPTDGFDSPTSSPGFQNVTQQPTTFDDYPILYDDGDGGVVRANITNGKIAFSPGTTFNVDGELHVIQEDGAPQPNLLFGYTIEGDGTERFQAGGMGGSAIEDPESNSAALVTTESFNIDGIVTGFGSIFADRNVSLRAKSGLRAEPDMAVAVHGESIRFQAEDPPDSSNSNTLLDTDWQAFKNAMAQSPGHDTFEGFYLMDRDQRNGILGSNPDLNTGAKLRSTGLSAGELWDLLEPELDLGSRPNFNASPFGSEWSGHLNLEKYVRLREYARSGSNSWLDFDDTRRFYDMLGYVGTNLSLYSKWAEAMGLPLADFMNADRPEIADVFFVGLVHAGRGGLVADTNGSSLLIEGAVVSQGGIGILEAPAVDFVYNRLYLDDVLREFRNDHIKLDQVYFKIN